MKKINIKVLIVLAVIFPTFMVAAADKPLKLSKTPLIDLWAGLSLGVINEDTVDEKLKSQLKSQNVKFMTALESEIDKLTSDLHKVHLVTGKQFTKLVTSMSVGSSFKHISLIGKTTNRVYLEVEIYLGKRVYTAIVCAPLVDLPAAILKKF